MMSQCLSGYCLVETGSLGFMGRYAEREAELTLAQLHLGTITSESKDQQEMQCRCVCRMSSKGQAKRKRCATEMVVCSQALS